MCICCRLHHCTYITNICYICYKYEYDIIVIAWVRGGAKDECNKKSYKYVMWYTYVRNWTCWVFRCLVCRLMYGCLDIDVFVIGVANSNARCDKTTGWYVDINSDITLELSLINPCTRSEIEVLYIYVTLKIYILLVWDYILHLMWLVCRLLCYAYG